MSVVTTDGVNWRADYSVTGSSYQGQSSLDIYFEDHAGNAGTRINETTDNSSVEIDTVIPQITQKYHLNEYQPELGEVRG